MGELRPKYERRDEAFRKWLKQQGGTHTTEQWIDLEHAFAYGFERGYEDRTAEVLAMLGGKAGG